MEMIAQKQVLSFKEATLYLGISSSSLYKKTSARTINFSKPNNGKIYFKKSDLDAWMLSNEHKSIESFEHEISNYLDK
ncbi:helix-turn-helix domain-containing protein [Fluviicola sp. SGL-29]|nr:helix-turn-helix domain-containing protein [Fluviicola sp. SGL-29]